MESINPELLGAIGVGVLLVFMFLGMPIGVCMIVVGAVGYALAGGNQILTMLAISTRSIVTDDTFAVMPIFLLMGEFADISGMIKEAYQAANIWLRKLPGGLAMASVVGAAAFSAVSGSSMACTAIMARVALPQLLDHKYDAGLSTGAIAAGGTLGNLIPPGTLLVVYAVMADVSLGQLFVACYLPGALLVLMYMAQIYIQCKIKPSMGPRGGGATWKEYLFATKGMLPVVVVLIMVLGGLQFGIYTTTEAASISAVFVFLFALARKTITRRNLLDAFKHSLVTTGMAFAIVIGADIFNVFIVLSQLPQALATWLVGLHLSTLGVIILIMVIYFIMGIPMNGITILLLTLPILLPLLRAYHIDLLWFGILAIVQCELANLTPPVGLNLFVAAAMAKPRGVTMATVFRGSIPYCLTCVLFLIILIAFPQISLFLVSIMKQQSPF